MNSKDWGDGRLSLKVGKKFGANYTIWKQYKMVDVNGAYKHGRYEKIWLNSLHVMSNMKVFDMRPPAGRTNTTHYINPYDTHMDQKCTSWIGFLIIITVIIVKKTAIKSSFRLTLRGLATNRTCVMAVGGMIGL